MVLIAAGALRAPRQPPAGAGTGWPIRVFSILIYPAGRTRIHFVEVFDLVDDRGRLVSRMTNATATTSRIALLRLRHQPRKRQIVPCALAAVEELLFAGNATAALAAAMVDLRHDMTQHGRHEARLMSTSRRWQFRIYLAVPPGDGSGPCSHVARR